jgi:hypothetical protein
MRHFNNQSESQNDWLDKVWAPFTNEPVYEEATRLGRARIGSPSGPNQERAERWVFVHDTDHMSLLEQANSEIAVRLRAEP